MSLRLAPVLNWIRKVENTRSVPRFFVGMGFA
jgi:hypothetical protein